MKPGSSLIRIVAIGACLTVAPRLPAPLLAAPPSAEESPAGERTAALTREISELARQVAALHQALAELKQQEATRRDARIAELDRQIQALTREIERLRSAGASEEGEDAGPGATGSWGLGPSASKVYARKRGVSIGGYGEMLLEAPGSERENGTASGRNAQLDFLRAVLYAGYKFDDNLLFNSELEFEHASTGEDGEVSVEFAYLDFLIQPHFNVRAGLLLAPMGWINELHEPPVYLGARRPLTERVILPSTWRENGAGLFGEHGSLSWRAYLVNSLDASGFNASGIRGGRQNGARALAEDFAVTARLDFEPAVGARLGASLWSGNAGQDADFDARTTLFDLHGEWRHRGLELRALYAHGSIGDAEQVNEANGLEGNASVGSRLEGGYLQVGYDLLTRVAGGEHALIPYLRWERVNTQAEVPDGYLANPATDQRIVTFGAAWKPHPQVVLKADFEDWSNEAETAVDQFNIQLGYIF